MCLGEEHCESQHIETLYHLLAAQLMKNDKVSTMRLMMTLQTTTTNIRRTLHCHRTPGVPYHAPRSPLPSLFHQIAIWQEHFLPRIQADALSLYHHSLERRHEADPP